MTNQNNIYNTIVIGAGIAGCCVAHFLHKKGVEILVLDRSGIAASGGSGAAGAFVSPKIGKGSPLQTLMKPTYLPKSSIVKIFQNIFLRQELFVSLKMK